MKVKNLGEVSKKIRGGESFEYKMKPKKVVGLNGIPIEV